MGQQEERITIEQILEQKQQVKGYDASVYTAICKHWDRVAKPLDGMGTFEPMLAQKKLQWEQKISFGKMP